MSILKVRKWAEKKLKSVMLVVLITFVVSIFFMGGGQDFSCKKNERDGLNKVGVVARVNNTEITSMQFDNAYSNLIRFYRVSLSQQIKPINLIDLRAGVLDQMVDREIKLQAAKKEKIKISKKEIEKKISEMAKNFKSRKEFEERVYQSGQNMEMVRAAVKEDLLIEKLEKKVKDKIKTSDEDIRSKYEQVKARHILIKVKERSEKDQEIRENEAKKKAEKIINEYNEGAEFSSLAQKYSEDPGSKEQGGDLGFFSRGQMVGEFERIAFSLQKGQVSAPVKTSYGYHIIKVEDKKEAKGTDFEKEKKKLKKEINETKGSQEWSKWTETARKKAKVEIYDLEIKAYKYDQEGKTDEAIKLYKEIIDKMPKEAKDSYVIYHLAKLQEKKNKIDEAIENYKLAIKHNEDDADFYFALGNMLEKKGEKDEAIKNFKKASSLAEDDLSLRYGLQTIWEKLNMQEEKEKESAEIAKIQEEMQKEMEERRIKEGKVVEEVKPIKVEVGGEKKEEPIKIDVGEVEERPNPKR